MTGHEHTGDDSGAAPDEASTGGTPRWVKVSGIVALVLVVLFVVLQLMGVGGRHGPGRHTPSGDADTPAATPPRGHSPLPGAHRQP